MVWTFRRRDYTIRADETQSCQARYGAAQGVYSDRWPVGRLKFPLFILAPSAHVGPYVGRFCESGTFWVLFGARLPAGSQVHAPDLSRAEIVVRLGALADDNRLRILQAVSEAGELSSQQIMADLGLSQSATSRHLKQLSATGYLSARRCNGAKCYQLDPERLEDTLQAVGSFLLGRS
jgi:DNA-binding transcriptional ArsR family regulator